MDRYLVNTHTKEIHDLEGYITPERRGQCKIDKIKQSHKVMINTVDEVQMKLHHEGYNACKWCLERYNTG